MDLVNPVAEGDLHITSAIVGGDGTSFNLEGEVGKYGRVFATMHLTSGDSERNSGTLEGDARTFMEDGNLMSATFAGSWRRSQGELSLFFVDNCSNGDQNFVISQVNLIDKSMTVKVYLTL